MDILEDLDRDVFDFPCSFAQQRLWMDDRLSGGSAFYNIHASIRVGSALEPALLERAVLALSERHESLRTTFVERDGVPIQRVAGRATCDFACIDLRADAAPVREARLAELAYAQAGQVFSLERGPLLRVRLVRTDQYDAVLMLTIHHIIADAWSMAVLLRELTALYGAAATGTQAALPLLEIQYADYAVWQRQAGAGAAGEASLASLAYWREQLAGLSTMALPLDHPRPPVASHRGHTLHVAFDPALSGALLAFAQRCMVTPYAVLVAALAVVFQRNCDSDEVVLGMPVAGRDRPELEHLIGFFVNTLVLRLNLSGEPGFADLARTVQTVLQDALSHQGVPFERLVEELHPPRDLSRNPLFQVSVQYLAAPGGVRAPLASSGEASAASVLEVQRGAANFDLSFDFWQAGGRIEGRVDFALDLFEESTVARWLAQMQRMLGQALDDPARSIETLDPLTSEERSLLLDGWAGASHSYPRDAGVAAVFATVAARQPQAPALRGAAVQLTYAQLEQAAGHCAAVLAAHGAAPGQRIGVALPRGAEQVIALLAVAQLGAAYVALDPAWPALRLRQCIDSAAIGLVLCEPGTLADLAPPGVQRLYPFGSFAAPDSVEPLAIDPMSPLYIAFTSGSTGTPKGVLVPQRAVLRLACANPQVALMASDTVLVYAPLAFDASTLEIWATLCNGACLSIAPAGPLGLDELAAWITQERVSVAWLTAGLFHQMAGAHAPVLAGLRQLYAGGDVLSADALLRVLACGGVTIFNGYGPTENTTFTCVYAMRSEADVGQPVPIGRPLAGGYVRVLDRRGRAAPIGVAGELYAGGDGVALGYLGAPELSREAFVDDPLVPSCGRVYRSGDRVRWRHDGVLEFLGRVDRQVKVRGYRIEPGEIESALRACAGVTDAHVLARADRSGDKTLVAYVAGPAELRAADLSAYLARHLPAWMLPGELHLCRALRLTPNGKIDTTALATLCAGPTAVSETAHLDGEVEELVAQVWGEVLGQPVSNPLADFFIDVGGHSLLATQVVSHLNAALGIVLPLAAMFEEPTIRAMARRVEDLLLADVTEDLP